MNEPDSVTPPARGAVPLFLTANLLYWASMYLYVPILPTHVEERTGSLAAVGIVVAMYGLGQALARIPAGIGVDATGRRRPFLVAGYLFSSAGAIVLAIGDTTLSLAVGRALTGLAAATWVPMVATFGTLFPRNRLVYATSLLTMVGGAGRVAAMTGGGFAAELAGPGLPFVLAAIAGVLAAAVITVSPLGRLVPKVPTVRTFASLLRRRDVLGPTVIQTVVIFANWAVNLSFLPILADRLGAGGTAKGLMLSLGVATSLVGNGIVVLVARRLGMRRTLYLSLLLQCAGIVGSAFAPSLAPLFLAGAVMGLATGMSYPTLMSLSMEGVEVEERATAVGIHQAVYAVGMFTGPWFGGVVAEQVGIPNMFLITAALTLAAAWPLIRRIVPQKNASGRR